MAHGTSGFFVERARFSRRASLLTLGVSLACLALLGFSRTPTAQKVLRRTARFGYQGADQYVRRISLQQHEGRSDVLSDLGKVAARTERKGGATRTAREGAGRPTPRARVTGPGSSDRDLVIRSVGRSANVPVVRSEDLVIDELVRPEYPPTLLEQNVEGKVMIQALIDTAGKVVEVQVVSSTGERLFERAAQDAVWRCRFRPYRPGGEATSEVYAVFRFAFRIY